jgi:hypothetical protein
MKLVRKFENGGLKDLYLIDDDGNEIRGICSSDHTSIVEVEFYEANFDLLLRFMPLDSGAFFTKESLDTLVDDLGNALDEAGIPNANALVANSINNVLRTQGPLRIPSKR